MKPQVDITRGASSMIDMNNPVAMAQEIAELRRKLIDAERELAALRSEEKDPNELAAEISRELRKQRKPLEGRMKPQVDITRGASFVQYEITGDLEAVVKAITTIFCSYDATAYGTKVQSVKKHENGNYTAQVWRALSCD